MTARANHLSWSVEPGTGAPVPATPPPTSSPSPTRAAAAVDAAAASDRRVWKRVALPGAALNFVAGDAAAARARLDTISDVDPGKGSALSVGVLGVSPPAAVCGGLGAKSDAAVAPESSGVASANRTRTVGGFSHRLGGGGGGALGTFSGVTLDGPPSLDGGLDGGLPPVGPRDAGREGGCDGARAMASSSPRLRSWSNEMSARMIRVPSRPASEMSSPDHDLASPPPTPGGIGERDEVTLKMPTLLSAPGNRRRWIEPPGPAGTPLARINASRI